MRIHALTVCVNYEKELAQIAKNLAPGLASWWIVTDEPSAQRVSVIAMQAGLDANIPVSVLSTDLFYADEAMFNKGRAMEYARQRMDWEDWILFVDADIEPEEGWHTKLGTLDPTILYGAARFQMPEGMLIRGDGIGVGYWQLFHSSDPALETPPSEPLIETHWYHAGNYDNGFMARWPRQQRRLLPIRLLHHGQRDNWCGKGNTHAFDEMMRERKRRGGWRHETIRREG